jgi:hypothetical protein
MQGRRYILRPFILGASENNVLSLYLYPMNREQVVSEDYQSADFPSLTALAGVQALDMSTGILYKQTAIPYGKAYREVGKFYYQPLTPAGGSVNSVTGLDTDNTDPANPIVQISVDGSTITGDGTPGSPLVSAGGGVPTSRTISTTSPLTGGGDLSANRTIAIPQATSLVSGYLSNTDWAAFDGKQAALGFTPENVANKATDLTSPDNTKYPTTLAVSTELDKVSVNKIMAYIAAKR